MLVVCNGAIKSGSTWLYNILQCLEAYSPIDEKYLTLRNQKHPCIRPEMLEGFLEAEDYVTRNFLTKNHIDKPAYRDLLLGTEHVYVFDIERDARDVVVSRYYHDCFRNDYQKSFREFYWDVGRRMVANLSGYHALWRSAGPRAYVSSYESLHNDFEAEVMRIAATLGKEVDATELRQIREKTSLGRLRKDYHDEPRFEGEKFFRKGKIGDWKNHFDDELLEDIRRVQEKGIGRIDLPGIRARLMGIGRK